jgi:peptidoglycan/xylan/chitin deacetylase (PgdA/CDA1 family)
VSAAKSIFHTIAPAVPLRLWHTLAGAPLVLPYYHMVSDESLPHVRPLYSYRNVRQFSDDLDFFLKHFQPISLTDLLAHQKTGKALPKRAFLVTFDDGFREMAEIAAPILKAKGVPAAFFVNSAFVDNKELCLHQKIALLIDRVSQKNSPTMETNIKELLSGVGIKATEVIFALRSVRYAQRAVLDVAGELAGLDFGGFLSRQKPYLSSEQIRSMINDGFAMGGHSIDHPFYGDLTLAEQLRQTQVSVDFVQQKYDLTYRAFAFPHSDSGVAAEFFPQSYVDDALEISFGTGGLLRDPWPRHFQRFSMEKTALSAKAVLTYQCARRAFKNLTGRSSVRR